jgi:serine/threonine protein kinase
LTIYSQPFIVMQLLEGQTLQERIDSVAEQRTRMPLAEVLDVAVQVASGLEAAHQKGLIHRDVKPANIFITGSGVVKILDFGLAKTMGREEEVEHAIDDSSKVDDDAAESEPLRPVTSAGATITRTGVAMGTAGYMSPEQVRGEKLDARTDIFSFGLVLYQMVTGQRAFPGKTTAIVHDAILHDTPIPIHELNSAIPTKLVAIIEGAWRKNGGGAIKRPRKFVQRCKR